MRIEEQQALTSYLKPNESLQWVGRPPSGLLFRKTDLFLIPFGMLWAVFYVFWDIHAFTDPDAPGSFRIFGAFMSIIGVYITIGRFVHDILLRRNTIYGLTTVRALILSGVFSQSVKSIYLVLTTDITLEQKSNGYGTITFGIPDPWRSLSSTAVLPGSPEAIPCFEMIKNVGSVYQMIQNIQRK